MGTNGFLSDDFKQLYANFSAPIAEVDCGFRCSPYNERGIPFCCDIHHAIPTAYHPEWDYLQKNTDLWKEWRSDDAKLAAGLREQTPQGQVLIACRGFQHCQREFRSLTCRAFPFFPYITREGKFIGLAYYWQYEERCWVINHLDVVTPQYLNQFVALYEEILSSMPDEFEAFRSYSITMRRVFGRKHRTISLLHRNGNCYRLSPGSGRMRKVSPGLFHKFGPYLVAETLPFPDEKV